MRSLRTCNNRKRGKRRNYCRSFPVRTLIGTAVGYGFGPDVSMSALNALYFESLRQNAEALDWNKPISD